MALDLTPHTTTTEVAPTLKRFPLAVRVSILEQLSLYLDTGNTLHHSLQLLANGTQSHAERSTLQALADKVADGLSFSQAAAQHPTLFTTTAVRLIEAGEKGGFLAQTLTQLVQLENSHQSLRALLIGALIYPVILLFLSLSVIGFMLGYVFPSFATLFESLGNELPLVTQILIDFSDWLNENFIKIFIILLIVLLVIYIWLRNDQNRKIWHNKQLHLPFIGEVLRQYHFSRVFRILAQALDGGIPLVDALKTCIGVTGNLSIDAQLATITQAIERGERISHSIKRSRIFPKLAPEMLIAADETGRISEVLKRLVAYYEEKLAQVLLVISKVIEPVMLVVMGIVVALVVTGVLLPIFKISQTVH